MKTSLTQITQSDLNYEFSAAAYAFTNAYRYEVRDEALFWSWFWKLNPARAAAAAVEAATAI